MGAVQKRKHRHVQHVQADPQTQSHIFVQKTFVPGPIHGPGRSRRKGIVVPSGPARPPLRSVPGDR